MVFEIATDAHNPVTPEHVPSMVTRFVNIIVDDPMVQMESY